MTLPDTPKGVIDAALRYERAIARARRVLTREERKLLTSTGPAPGSTGATRRQITAAFKLVRAALSAGKQTQDK